MNEPYQIPGLLLTVICHIIVVYHMSEHRYAKKRFGLCSLICAVFFVSLMGYGYAAGECVCFSHIWELCWKCSYIPALFQETACPKSAFCSLLISVCFPW